MAGKLEFTPYQRRTMWDNLMDELIAEAKADLQTQGADLVDSETSESRIVEETRESTKP